MLDRLKLKLKVSRKMAYEGIATRLWPVHWGPGNRSETGKYKLAGLFDIKILDRWHFQGLLAHYPVGARNEPHKDHLKNHDIYRAVVVLKKSEGGELLGNNITKIGPLYLLRPDLSQHEVTEVTAGERLSLLLTLYKRRTTEIKVEKV